MHRPTSSLRPRQQKSPAADAAAPVFWRDAALPFIEARAIGDGRLVSYGAHAHETFAIGAVTGGRSRYLNERKQQDIGAGAVVLMNPETMHACNPLRDQPWAYRMLYVDIAWLTRLQHELGHSANADFRCFSEIMSVRRALFAGLNRLYGLLTDPIASDLQKHGAAVAFFCMLQQTLAPAPAALHTAPPNNPRLTRAADFIRDNFASPLKLEDICQAAELSASYLIRAFDRQYGTTPHAYLVNRRIQYSRQQLRRGRAIAEVALDAGFADQAHLQRAFKRLVAATPGQYRYIKAR